MSNVDYAIADSLCMRNSRNAIHGESEMRIRIQWDIDGYPADYDNCTIVTILNDYVMLVRVGWNGDFPLLMAFPSIIREFDEFDRPVIRERNGIPWNYQN